MDGGKPVPGAKPTRTNDAGAAAERFLSDTTREVDELSHSAGAAPPARPTPPARAPRALPDVKPAPPPPVRKRAESERAYDPESTTMPHKPTPSADAIAAAVLAIANEDLTVVEGSSEANIAPGDHGCSWPSTCVRTAFCRSLPATFWVPAWACLSADIPVDDDEPFGEQTFGKCVLWLGGPFIYAHELAFSRAVNVTRMRRANALVRVGLDCERS